MRNTVRQASFFRAPCRRAGDRPAQNRWLLCAWLLAAGPAVADVFEVVRYADTSVCAVRRTAASLAPHAFPGLRAAAERLHDTAVPSIDLACAQLAASPPDACRVIDPESVQACQEAPEGNRVPPRWVMSRPAVDGGAPPAGLVPPSLRGDAVTGQVAIARVTASFADFQASLASVARKAAQVMSGVFNPNPRTPPRMPIEPVLSGWPSLPALVAFWDGGATPFCGGTLVGPSAVLTAAHCILDTELKPKRGWTVKGCGGQAVSLECTPMPLEPGTSTIPPITDVALCTSQQPLVCNGQQVALPIAQPHHTGNFLLVGQTPVDGVQAHDTFATGTEVTIGDCGTPSARMVGASDRVGVRLHPADSGMGAYLPTASPAPGGTQALAVVGINAKSLGPVSWLVEATCPYVREFVALTARHRGVGVCGVDTAVTLPPGSCRP